MRSLRKSTLLRPALPEKSVLLGHGSRRSGPLTATDLSRAEAPTAPADHWNRIASVNLPGVASRLIVIAAARIGRPNSWVTFGKNGNTTEPVAPT